jgi:hypothetical protein
MNTKSRVASSKPFAGCGRRAGNGLWAQASRLVTLAGNERQIIFESTLERDYD